MSWELIAVSLVVLNQGPLTKDSPVMVKAIQKTLGVYSNKGLCEINRTIARTLKEKHVKVKCLEIIKENR